MTQFYGKYRGVVTDNKDPSNRGRIRAQVPDVMGVYESGWAMPCAPFAGQNMGFCALPPIGAGVWIEFEQGDPDSPIWSGCWWGSKEERPDEVQADPEQKVLIKTSAGHSILLDDTNSGQITLQTKGGQKIIATDADGGQIAIETAAGQKIILTNADGQITIETAAGQKIALQAMTITVDNGSAATIDLDGPRIDLNKSALEVL
jgi:uncharacterized protein involved in type VI secretion and phage assembly